MTREEFEREFNSRTLAYHPEFRNDERPVVVIIGEDAHNEPGHALASALVNLLARAHSHLVLVGDLDRQLECRDPLGATTLREATLERAIAINPFIHARAEAATAATPSVLVIGLGCEAELRVGADRWCASFGPNATIDASRTSLLGASLAAALTASVAFHRQLGNTDLPSGAFSLYDYGRASEAQGPEFSGPLDLGQVLQVGAGAVACAFDYWAATLGVVGPWVIVDGDVVDVSNLNRQILFVACDAGFPGGERRAKAEIAATAIGQNARTEVAWLDETDVRLDRYDLILPLANERAARRLVQLRPEPLLLHAITTPNWTTIAHRHIQGRDGCIVCRIPEEHDPSFTCATGVIGTTTRQDASLPFLSAAAGALLLAEVARLQTGVLKSRQANYGALDLRNPKPVTTSFAFPCKEGCLDVLPAEARERLAGATRWAALASGVT